MRFSRGDKLTCRISRISKSGNAITGLHDGEHINLGQIPKIEGEVPVVITDNTSHIAADIRPNALDSPLTLVTTEKSRRIIPTTDETVEEEVPNITVLDLGVTKLFLERPIPVDSRVTLGFEELTEPANSATILSIEELNTSTKSEGDTSDKQTVADRQSSSEAAPEDGLDIKELVGRLDKFASKDSTSITPGGETREKYDCKCCGTRVDPGTHKCDLCKKAGCDAFNKHCRFV